VSPRADETPRRGREPRRGASREQSPAEDSGREDDRTRGFGGIGDARAYTPRGRTVREGDQRTRSPRAGRDTDPFRPALQVLDGGRPARGRRREPEEPTPPTPPSPQRRGREARDERERQPKGRAARGTTRAVADDDDEWDDTPRRPGRTTAGAARARSTANPRRGAATARTDAGARTGRERKVAAPPGPRRGTTGRTGKAAPPARAARPGSRRPAPVPAKPPKLANSTRRLRLGTVLALALFVMIGVRLIVLQVVETPASAQSLLEQRKNRLTDVTLPAPRGSILDRSGAVLAHSVEARYIYADPELVNNASVTAAKLSPELGVPTSRLIRLMAKKKRPGGGPSRFEYLARGVDIAVAERIAGMKLPGIGSDRDTPLGDTSEHSDAREGSPPR